MRSSASTNSPKSPASSSKRWRAGGKAGRGEIEVRSEVEGQRAASKQPHRARNPRPLSTLDLPRSSRSPLVLTYIPDYATPRFRLTPRHFAYVKIAEGCNHPCSFCIIPRLRGSHRSRPPADLLAEARALIADGVKELNLISQDSTYYGLDLRPNRSQAISAPGKFSAAVKSLPAETPTICTLLRQLNALPVISGFASSTPIRRTGPTN